VVDSGWFAVLGAVVGAGTTGTVTLLQARWQRRDTAEQVHRDDVQRRRGELTQLFTRYQLAADRVENAIRALRGPDGGSQDFEAAQNEYDEACQVVGLLAPPHTADVVLRQRRLFNELAEQAMTGRYDHDRSRHRIADAAQPVLDAMRTDLGTA
jgi:hypothetical protein